MVAVLTAVSAGGSSATADSSAASPRAITPIRWHNLLPRFLICRADWCGNPRGRGLVVCERNHFPHLNTGVAALVAPGSGQMQMGWQAPCHSPSDGSMLKTPFHA